MTKQQFSDEVQKSTGLLLGKDYLIEVGTMAPYHEAFMQSAGMFEGFKVVVNNYRWIHHFTKGGDYQAVSDTLTKGAEALGGLIINKDDKEGV